MIPIDVAVRAAPTKIAVRAGWPSDARQTKPAQERERHPGKRHGERRPADAGQLFEVGLQADFEEEQDHADLGQEEDAARQRHEPEDGRARAARPRAARRAPPAAPAAQTIRQAASPRAARMQTPAGTWECRSR